MPLHLHRVKVEQHVVHDHVRAVPGAVRVALAIDRAGPEDRVPGLRALQLVADLGRARTDLGADASRSVAVAVPVGHEVS